MSQLNVAIFGCGRMGHERAAKAAGLGARIVAVHDVDARAAARLASQHPDCQVAESPLRWDGVDAVFVCTPPNARGIVEVEALRRRIPVFVEKPIGLSAEGLNSLLMDCPTDCITAVGYMNRYRESVELSRQALANKVVLGGTFHWIASPYKVGWWSRPDRSGGPFNEQGTHLVDVARYLLGDVVEVQALAPEPTGTEPLVTTISCSLRFDTGTLCSMLYSCKADTKLIGIRLFMEDMEFVMKGWDFQLEPNEIIPVPPPSDSDRTAIFAKETEAFLRAVSDGDQSLVRCDFREALKTQKTVDAIRKAVHSGRRERVS